jgi:hypothetical protein
LTGVHEPAPPDDRTHRSRWSSWRRAPSSSFGTSTWRSIFRRCPMLTIVGRARHPTRKLRNGLDRPLRCRETDSHCRFAGESIQPLRATGARCAPRLFGATAWISSTITVWNRLPGSSGSFQPSRSRYNDSGVVMRMCGGFLASAGGHPSAYPRCAP